MIRNLCLAMLLVLLTGSSMESLAGGPPELRRPGPDSAPKATAADTRYVDGGATGSSEEGTSSQPFRSVLEGVLDVPSKGAVVVKTGTYAEKMILRKPMEVRAQNGTVVIGQGVSSAFLDCSPDASWRTDDDGDGVIDSCEQALAEKYAPIVFHSNDESNLPTNVDWFLPKTALYFYDDGCQPDFHELVTSAPSQDQLLSWSYVGGCGSSDTVYSDGTRSESKQRTFYLADVASGFQIGSLDTRDWVTYVHAYPNTSSGVTIQYWRFYAYNNAFNNHGGDWEGIHLVLNSSLTPSIVGFMGHTSIDFEAASELEWEGNHPRIYSEGGGHASHDSGSGIYAKSCGGLAWHIDADNPCTYIRQETWKTGQVTWCNNSTVDLCDGGVTPSGGLLNLGAKIGPMNQQSFIKYSGIWGSPGYFGYTSGYWGPAFNETGMGDDGYVKAWCSGITGVNTRRECYPKATTR
jgi:hypothetical protein